MPKRPRVIINCAASADGKLALPSRRQTKISSEEDMARVYALRNSVDAVLVGIGTVLSDDPRLTVKDGYVDSPGKPLRIILDSKCRTPPDALALNDAAPSLLVAAQKPDKTPNNAKVLVCGGRNGRVDLHNLLSKLYERGIGSVLVEGGGTVIWSFLEAGLFDEFNIYVGSMIIGGSTSPTPADGEGAKGFADTIPLDLVEARPLGDGVLLRYVPKIGLRGSVAATV